jgi:diguanylate cyclase (GGDEF)-like protein
LQFYYDAQLKIARELLHKTQYDAAISILDEEIPKLEETKNYKSLGECINLKIACLFNKGDIQSVQPLLEQLKYCLLVSGHEDLQLNHLYHSANFFYYSGDIEHSIEYNLKVLEALETMPSHHYYPAVCHNLIGCYILLKELEKASYYIEKIYLIMNAAKHEQPIMYIHYMNTVACYLFELNKYDESYKLLKEVLAHPLLKQDSKHYATTINNIGVYYSRINQYQKADRYFTEAWSIIKEISDVQLKSRILNTVIESYEIMENYKKAYEYARIKNELLESEESRLQLDRLHEFALSTSKAALNLLAYTDHLTQVYNRHFFEEEAEKWLLEAQSDSSPLCCALFDIDDFKEKNNQYGYFMGDQILRHIGEEAKKFNCTGKLFIARYGGDKFIVLSKEPALFKQTMEHLFHTLQAIEILFEDQYLMFTISLGAVIVENVTDFTVSMLIQKADEELYKVKINGKNALRVV